MHLLFLYSVLFFVNAFPLLGDTFQNTNGDILPVQNQAESESCMLVNSGSKYGLREGESIRALARQLRVDLIWRPGALPLYQVQRASTKFGPWEVLHNPTAEFHMYSDYVGEADCRYFYRVRNIRLSREGNIIDSTNWSDVVSANTLPFERNDFLGEVQEACVRFYFEEAHPVSGLSQEGAPGWGNTSAIGSSGMGMANIIVGVHRGFVSYEQGVALALKMLRFLDQKATRQAGAFAHWMDGETGEPRKFGVNGTAADIVETSFVIQGAILLREYFDGSSPDEREIGLIATRLAAQVQWSQFMSYRSTGPVMIWHWSAENGLSDLTIRGFHEAMMPYILGIGSDTYSIPADSFYTGWYHPDYGLGNVRENFGIKHTLGRGIGWPLFFSHYSHIGFDPRMISYKGRTYFEHFVAATMVHRAYAVSKADDFKGYEKVWGLTASMSPFGYKAHQPGRADTGTIASTASLSSMPYLPEEVLDCMETMYLNYGEELWGCFGFYNAFNPSEDWVANKYIGIELGPIAPMIENYRTGLLWKLFMRAPEVKRALSRINALAMKQ